MVTAMATLGDLDIRKVERWIESEAKAAELETIIAAVQERRRLLGGIVRVGNRVRTHGLAPKYLNGLEAVVAQVSGRKATLRIEKGTATWDRLTRDFQLRSRLGIFALDGDSAHATGFPVSCLEVLD